MEANEISTLQELFDFVVGHLARQGRPAKNDDGHCVYATSSSPDSLRCAVGCLIDPAKGCALAPGQGAAHESVVEVLPSNVLEIDPETNLLWDLQIAHDKSTSADKLRSILIGLAAKFSLNPSSVEQITTWDTTPIAA